MQNLDAYARQGLPILCLEPSCASALADDLPDLIDDAELGRRVAACVTMIDVFLDREVAAGRIPPLAATASAVPAARPLPPEGRVRHGGDPPPLRAA